MITFSGLLNCLDGICFREGLITIMTTNFKDKIAGVLSRPGRIDYSIEFKKMQKPEIKKMVRNLSTFSSTTDDEVKLIIANYIKGNPAIESEQVYGHPSPSGGTEMPHLGAKDIMVGGIRVELMTSAMSTQRSKPLS